mgnify:CR=1 FL=1
MGTNSKIEWTDHTWNPWQGCHKVSEGCRNCYMFRDLERWDKDPNVVRQSGDATFRRPLTYTQPALIFTCSWSDFFIEDADLWRPQAWDIIRATPHLTYQILTKRPENIPSRLPADWGDGWPHVWLGVSVEDQHNMRRWMDLTQVPAALHFVSAEPLLGPLWFPVTMPEAEARLMPDLVIIGGEAGPDARVSMAAWIEHLLAQAKLAKAKVFV